LGGPIFREPPLIVGMKSFRAFILAAVAAFAATPACTSQDSLLDDPVAPGAGQSGASGQGGSGGSGGSTGGTAATAGKSSSGGASGSGGAATGGTGGGTTGGTGGGASGGAGGGTTGGTGGGTTGGTAGLGGSGNAGSGGTDPGGSGGSSGEAGSGGAEQCPPGQMWCPGCTPDSGGCGVACTGAVCTCAQASTFEECEARLDCHSVFEDPGTCGCGLNGCCARFSRCAEGEKVDCSGAQVMCDALTPFCDNPAYVNSYSGFCYEGCVDPKDCAPPECPASDCPSAPGFGPSCTCSDGVRCLVASGPSGSGRCRADDGACFTCLN
jgi:hypothetical protein